MLNYLIIIYLATIVNNASANHYPANKCLANITSAQIKSDYVIISKINIVGNKNTKKHIITRELTFSEGDTILISKINQNITKSRENLLNTSLFNYVTIDTTYAESDKLDVTIVLEERWYIWPYPIFEHADRNFNAWLQTEDWSKINYGFYLTQYNFRGRNEILKIKVRLGYKQQFSILYSNPNINKNQTDGLHGSISYFRQHEIAYRTYDNKLHYYKSNDEYVRESIASSISYSFRKYLYNKHIFSVGYNQSSVIDTIAELNDNYFGNRKTNIAYFSAGYLFSKDMINSKYYPLKGYYFNFRITKLGLGIIHNNNDLNVLYIKSCFKKYFYLAHRLYFASKIKIKKSTNQNQPYYVQKALGYANYLRGYEYYVIDGQDFAIFKNSLKYELIPVKIKYFKFVPFPKFNKVHYALYFNLFFDSGYVVDNNTSNNNSMSNIFLYSGGAGFDFVSYYDKVFRIDFSINKFGESGFFFHLSAPI